MVNRKSYFNDFAYFMMVLIVGSLIVGAIEGINIGRNVKSYYTFNEEVAPGDYILFNFEINEGARIYLDYDAENLSIYNNDADAIISIMREYDFELWVEANSTEPGILNSTFYYDDSRVNINNLQVPHDGVYYFIVYNHNPYDIEVNIDVTIVPWGHIIAAGIMTILLLFGLIGIGTRLIHATVYNARQERRASRGITEEPQVAEQPATNKKEGVFCQSCGAPLTLKDKRYCPQCGASV
ncbi:MAG: zinc ribbon domain-containing protein [Candidatus Heimdallarchaeota archaeon]|nr:zinc ribbon domain-containing protein [Candidatus Heimdallarchaeota archaeon]